MKGGRSNLALPSLPVFDFLGYTPPPNSIVLNRLDLLRLNLDVCKFVCVKK